MLPSVSVDWLAILVAGIVNMVLGMIWYSPMLFGKSWMELMGKKGEEMKPQPGPLAGMFILALVMAYIMTYFVAYAGANTFVLGLEVGAWAALGFTVLSGASANFASGTSWKLWAINSGYWLISFALMGGVIASMR